MIPEEDMVVLEEWKYDAECDKVIDSAKFLIVYAKLKNELRINEELNRELESRDARDQYLEQRGLSYGNG
jgi:hypothetical protein